MTNKQALVQLCVDAVKNPAVAEEFAKAKGKKVDETIRAKFCEILGTEKPTYKDIMLHDKQVFAILAEVLTETYVEGIEESSFFMQFADIRNIARGDQNEFYLEDDAVLVVSEHSGDHWNIRRQKYEGGQSFTVETKTYSIGVYADFFRFVTGRIDFAKLITKTGEAIIRKIEEEVAASFQVGAAQLPAEFYQTGSFTETELTKIYAHVQAATGSQPIVLGTQAALNQVTAGLVVDWASNEMKNELNTTGRIGTYKGMTLVQLPQVHKANTWEFAYDDNQLLILPSNNDKFVKLVFEGQDMIKEVTDAVTNNDMSIEYLLLTRFGVHTVFSSVFGLYKLA